MPISIDDETLAKCDEKHILELVLTSFSVDRREENPYKSLLAILEEQNVEISTGTLANVKAGRAHLSAEQWIVIEKATGYTYWSDWVHWLKRIYENLEPE